MRESFQHPESEPHNKTPYEVLGVAPGANEEEIKKVYRRLVMVHHPDRGGNPVRFREIGEAYAVLGDPEKRAAYDKGSEKSKAGDTFDQTLERWAQETTRYNTNVTKQVMENDTKFSEASRGSSAENSRKDGRTEEEHGREQLGHDFDEIAVSIGSQRMGGKVSTFEGRRFLIESYERLCKEKGLSPDRDFLTRFLQNHGWPEYKTPENT